MAAIWPLTLPQCPKLSGFSEKVPNNLIRSDMDTGPAKVRRRGGAKPWTCTAPYTVSKAQLAMLQNFVVETLANGALCFDWPHPVRNDYVRARLVGGSDSIFDASPSTPDLWQVTLTIEWWPGAPLT